MRQALLLTLGAAGLLLFACGSDTSNGSSSGDAGGDAGASSSSSSSSSGASSTSSSGSSGTEDAGADGSSGGDGGSDPPYAVVYSAASPIGIDQRTPVAATFATNGALDSYTYAADEAPERGTGAVYNVFKDANAGVGRWSDGQLGGKFYGNPMPLLNNKQGYHYGWVLRPASIPAPVAATYAVLGASQPTMDDGTTAIGTATTGSMATAVDGATMRVGIELSVVMPDDGSYTVTTTGGTATPATSPIVANGTQLGFAGTASVTTATGAACSGGACTANIRAMRSANNERIVIAFVITSAGATGKAVRGSVAFGKK